jgi:preprotein translocase subunit SecA
MSGGISNRLQALFGGPVQRRLAQWTPLLERIAAYEPELQAQSVNELRKRSLSLRYRAKSQEPLDRIMCEAFALVRESGRRQLNMRHFDVQMLGGAALCNNSIAEMQTGEGKTLTATLPLYLYALAGRGAHLATVNDYLARRDADWMRPIFELLGMSVGVIESQMTQDQRRAAYACDVTYGTSKEFGFDFLRDRLLERSRREGDVDMFGRMLGQTKSQGEQPVQREHYFCLVDEADSILIDEARTPLIISAVPTERERIAVQCFQWAARVAEEFVEDDDYEYDHIKRTVELTFDGRHKTRTLPKPDALDAVGMYHIYEYVERAIKVNKSFTLDRQYVIRDDEIVIVDEFTGRLSEGRKWRDGLHQAVEAKEGVTVTVDAGQAARVTVQDFFHRYEKLAGMTGTGATSSRELKKIYKLLVVPIPTNRPAIRQRLPDRIFGTSDARWAAIVEEVREIHATGRPVLIGTRSIDKSHELSKRLEAVGIVHRVLNANQIAAEAEIVSHAGEVGRVTVSTNMAGRGTDIKLGPGVHELGGLHVICTEMHDSARIDRQLIGRCGRQGDPGTYRQYLALDDEILLAGLGAKRSKRLTSQGEGRAEVNDVSAALFRKAQRKIEGRHYRDRRVLMYYEKERKKVHIRMGQDPYLDAAN